MGDPGSKRERSFCSSFIRPWIECRSTLSRCLLSAARRRAKRAAPSTSPTMVNISSSRGGLHSSGRSSQLSSSPSCRATSRFICDAAMRSSLATRPSSPLLCRTRLKSSLRAFSRLLRSPRPVTKAPMPSRPARTYDVSRAAKVPRPAKVAKGARRTISRRERFFLLSTRTLLALLGLRFDHLVVGRGLDRLAQAHLDLHHLELPLGVESLYVDLGRRYLALGLARAELADGLGLVGGLADGLPRLLQVARGVGEGDVGAGLVGGPEGAGALMLLHQGRTLAHHVVVAALLVTEGLLQLLGVLAGLFQTRLDI